MSERPAQPLCFHCLQPVPAGLDLSVTIAGEPRPMCCYGCQAVASTIIEHGLGHFYQFRDTSNPATVALVPEELQELEAYDQADIQKSFVREQANGTRSIVLSVDGMTCAACAWLIERETHRLAGIERVLVNATTERVHVTWHPDQVSLSNILKSIAGIGYRALPFQQAVAEQDFSRKRKQYVRRLGVAGIATMQVMMIAVGLYFGVVSDLDPGLQSFLWWVSWAFATPVILYSAQPFYLSALRSIQAGRPNMDVPVSIALLGAYGASTYATLIQQGDVYFESVSMFTLFLLGGRYIELLARQKAVSVAANLIKLLPALADKETHDGQVETLLVQQLSAGDVIRVKAGATLPVDGELLTPQAFINESLLSGESRPVAKQAKDMVLAGSVNQQQPIRLRVTATQQQTVLAGIVDLQDTALANKPKLAQMADRIASVFVWRLLIIAAATFIVWYWIDPSKAFWVTLSVLVATCPCALALAAPTAITGTIHRLNRSGILIRNGDILEQVAKLKTIFFDKTGTLTEGDFRVTDAAVLGTRQAGNCDRLTAGLESYSEHPIALPLRQRAVADQFTELNNTAGAGLEGLAANDGQRYRIGSLAFVQQWHPDFTTAQADHNVYLASQAEVLASYRVTDTLRPDAAAVLGKLRAAGYQLVMLTGDNEARAQEVAQAVGIDELQANCSPADKLQAIQVAQQTQVVMVVGDGINDAPVLAQADMSVSFSAAADLAKASADAIILNGRLDSLDALVAGAGRCRRIMRQNMTWALVYNISILPVAMAGFVTPYIAAIGMSLSSLLVLLNSLRLYRA